MLGSKAASVLAGTSTDSSEAKTIYHLTCGNGEFRISITLIINRDQQDRH